MDYHILLFDYHTQLQWVHHRGDRVELSTKRPPDMMQRIRNRLYGFKPPFLDEAVEIRRNILRFGEGIGLVVYYVRLSHVRSFTNVVDFLTQRSG
jgi:hypothetical protein